MTNLINKYEIGDLGIGQTLDVAGSLLRNRFWDLLKICLFFFIPAYVLINLSTYYLLPSATTNGALQNLFDTIENPEIAHRKNMMLMQNPLNLLIVYALMGLNALLILPLTRTAVCRLVAFEYLGRVQLPQNCFGWAVKKYFRVLGAYLLFTIIIGGIATGIGVAVGIMVAGGGAVAGGLGVSVAVKSIFVIIMGIVILACVLLYIYFYLRFCLFLPAIVVEEAGTVQSIGRSSKLTHGRISRFFWVLSVAWIICGFVAASAYMVPGGWMTMVLISVATAIAEIFTCAVEVVYYFNCRCVHENLDIVLMSDSVRKIPSLGSGDQGNDVAAPDGMEYSNG